MKKTEIDVQGHRGCRGLYPENTVEGFLRALKLGVSTLEMDLVISKDSQVVVSHEPFFSHEIAIDPNGLSIREENENEHNIFQILSSDLVKYDVGLKPHVRFPNQEKTKESKALLQDVFDTIEEHCKENNIAPPDYNIEIKRKIKWDNIFHPSAEEFSDLVFKMVKESGFEERIVVQCFDIECLQIAKRKYPNIKLSLLIENSNSPKENIERLGFIPEVYSPHYKLVNNDLVNYCRANNMKLIPWTVNSIDDIEDVINMGVDGIISDYPDKVVNYMNKHSLTIKSCF